MLSVLRVLDNGDATFILDNAQSGRTIVEVACQHHPDHPFGIRMSGRPEHGVDGGSCSVLLRQKAASHIAALDDQVKVGGSDIYNTGTYLLRFSREENGKRTGSGQNLGKITRPGRIGVKGYKERRGKLFGSPERIVFTASIPPADAPIATISCIGINTPPVD